MNDSTITVEYQKTARGSLTPAVVIGVDCLGSQAQVLQSYATQVMARVNGVYFITPDVRYSTTTSKHCKQFCGFTGAQLLKMAKDEEPGYVLVDNEQELWENIGGAI